MNSKFVHNIYIDITIILIATILINGIALDQNTDTAESLLLKYNY